MNPEKPNGILVLCDAAEYLDKQDQDVQTEPQSTSVEESHGQTVEVTHDAKLEETYKAGVKTANYIDINLFPNNLMNDYFENISDELNRRFRFRCNFSPFCSEVIESYGNESKGFIEMKKHLIYHHFSKNSSAEIKKKIDLSKCKSGRGKLLLSALNTQCRRHVVAEYVPKSPEKINAKKKYPFSNSQFLSKMEQNRILSILDGKISEEAENAHVPLDTKCEEKDSTDLSSDVNIIRLGQCEHDYAKNYEKSVKETRRKKCQKSNIVSRKEIINLVDNVSESRRPVLKTPLFPFVYTPCPLEPVQIVELNSNGEPISYMEPVFVQPSTCKTFFKKPVENKVGRKKIKISATACTHRSVLECVENRVACKSNFLLEQRDAVLPDDSNENSENVEKIVHDIAWRNIKMLTEQRGKRKYRDKPTVYICEICERRFTANTSLTYHYLGHLKIKPFKCDICYRAFTRRHSLKYHMMIHANKNRFQCPTCKRLFRHPSHYKEHLRKHTGEEPFSCKFCSNKFKTRNSFKRHLKMQHQKLLTSNGIVPIRNDA